MALDSELLRLYAEDASEEAFAELVRRHLDLVYSAALRQVNGDAHLAQDVAQTVFSDLARKAKALWKRPALTGWLYTSTHFAAAKAVRTECRRRTHEKEAQAMQEILGSPTSDVEWERLGPLLDRAMHQLKESDRDIILMRYFENQPLAAIGARIGLSEDGARKRVDRALERLGLFLAKRGITTAATLSAALSAHAVHVAPAGLAATLTSASLAGAGVGTGVTLTLIQVMATAKLKSEIIGLIVLASVVAPLVVQQEAQGRLRGQNDALRVQSDRLAKLQAEHQRLSNSLAQIRGRRETPPEVQSEVLRLRGEVGRLQHDMQELAPSQSAALTPRNQMLAKLAEGYATRVSQLKKILEANPAERIPELQFLSDDNWLWLAHKRPVATEDAVRRAMSTIRQMAEENFVSDLLFPALQKYAETHNGQFPKEVAQLRSYFQAPVDDAVLERWVVLPKSKLVPGLQRQLEEEWYVTQKEPVNPALDQRIFRGLKSVHDFADGPPSFWDTLP